MDRMPDLGDRLTLREEARQPRDLTMRSLQIRAGTIDEANRSIEVVLASEGIAQVFDMRSFSIIDEVLRMDGCDMPSQMPLLADHDRFSIESVRGSIRDLRVDGTRLVGRAYFATDPDSDRAWQKVKQGHLTDVSAGYRVTAATDIAAGETRDVNGKAYTAGQRTLRVSTRWQPKEGSLVPIGADPAAKFREDTNSTTTRAKQPDQDTPMERFKQWLQARGLNHDTLTDAQRAALKADFDGEVQRAEAVAAAQRAAAPVVAPAAAAVVAAPAAPAAPAVSESERAMGMRLERERINAIRSAGEGVDAALVERAITEGWDVGRSSTEFLTSYRAARRPAVGGDRDDRGQATARRGNGAPIEVLVASEDKFVRAAEVAMLQRAGVRITDDGEMTAVQRTSEAACLRGLGLQDLARLALRAHREEAPIGAEALFARAISTYSFPTALGNTLNRMLLSAYETAPSTMLDWAARMPVTDFRTHKAIKVGKFGKPEKVGKAGNVTHGDIKEEAESFSADTYAQGVGITRQDFINDDLGVFTRVPMELGSSMKLNIDDIGYALLTSAAGVGPTMATDSTALFSASRGDGSNYSATTTVLSSAGLTTLKTLFRKIQQSGRQLNLMPEVLLVPAALEQTALELVKSTNIIVAGSTDTVRGSVNVHGGTLRVVVEPRLDGATNGGTAWYLICNPVRAKSLAVSFLNGQESPSIERIGQDNPLAMNWLCYHDVGVSAVDWRGIIRSKGA